jgi:glycerol-3-phosphate dehydrogenase
MKSSTTPDRATQLQALSTRSFDIAIIGGGATGLAIALEASQRGYSVALIERADFSSGTSSRSTKLLHGGVRYLAQGNIRLVREALRERRSLIRMAPELAHPLRFVMPAYRWYEKPFYGVGLHLYDLLSGPHSLGPTRIVDTAQTLIQSPGLRGIGLRGSVSYWDAQFDDSGMALAMARTAAQCSALIVNYVSAEGLDESAGRICGLRCRDRETGHELTVKAQLVVNASGVWVDQFRTHSPMVRPSQGTHLVVDAGFFPGDHALLIPRTRDDRVLFVVPWLGRRIIGTTDVPVSSKSADPIPQDAEIAQLLGDLAPYLAKPPRRGDVLSVWSGLRPLVNMAADSGPGSTGALSREHAIDIDARGLLTITGGKWTTCLEMARDALERAVDASLIGATRQNPNRLDRLVKPIEVPHDRAPDAETVQQLAIEGFARTVADVLARRSRLLFLDARAAIAAAPTVARHLQTAINRDPALDRFMSEAKHFLLEPASTASAISTIRS